MEERKKLGKKEYIYVASMLFGLFFGAGNLIFPVYMGQMAGRHVWSALAGFIITGVGLPLLGVAALGISKSEGLFELGSMVGRKFAYFFTCLLYLTIGPFFAIPRCATTSFTVGIESILPDGISMRVYLLIFSVIFFAAALLLSLYPGKILIWVGKILNPFFLLFLSILIIAAFVSPSIDIAAVEPSGAYAEEPFFTGFLEGYNTMDALAGLAFGIIVVHAIRRLGVEDAEAVAAGTVKSGFFSCVLMALIYTAVTIVGTQSRGAVPLAANGGEALADIARHYLGRAGFIVLAVTVTVACLKTAVGLITSCSETFTAIFTKGPSYRCWAVIFSIASFVFSNLGLDMIIAYSLPVLMFLYPLAVVLIILAFTGRMFDNDRIVCRAAMLMTMLAAVYDMLRTLPEGTRAYLHIDGIIAAVGDILPFASIGLAWICPAVIGFAAGILLHLTKKQTGT